MRTPRLLLAALVGTTALLAASSAVADNQTVDATPDDVFSPAKIAVKPGETVTFTNSGGNHNVVWNDGKEPPRAGYRPRTEPVAARRRRGPQRSPPRASSATTASPTATGTSTSGWSATCTSTRSAAIPPSVTGLTASATRTKATLKFRSSRAGEGARRRSSASPDAGSCAAARSSFSARSGRTTKTVTRAFTKGSWRVEVIVTDANKLASDKRSKTFSVR